VVRKVAIVLLVLFALDSSSANAQSRADSVATAELRASDNENIDVDDYLDELESVLSDIDVYARTRATIDPSASDESGFATGRFLGSPVATLERTILSYGPITAGFAGQKQVGERSYIDNWAAFAELHQATPIGPVSIARAVVGSYGLSFGQGLVFGSGLSSVALRTRPAHAPAKTYGLRHALSPHSTSDFLGAAFRLESGDFSITPFASSRKLDGRVDSSGIRTLSSYYHRTAEEESLRGALTATLAGAHLSWSDSALGTSLGATAASTTFDPPLNTNSVKLLHGARLLNGSIDAAWSSRAISLAMEGAVADAGQGRGFASIATLTATPIEQLRLLAMYHYQDTNYFAPYASIADAPEGDVSNEEGYWLGMESSLSPTLLLSSAIGFSGRIRNDATVLSSPKRDGFLDLRFTPSSALDVALRYRSRLSDDLGQADVHGIVLPKLETHHQSNLRLLARYTLTPAVSLRLRSEATRVSATNTTTNGIFGQLGLEVTTDEMTLHALLARFSTESYDARVYGYTSTVSGSGALLQFIGTGWYSAVGVRRSLFEWMTVEAFAGGYFYDHERSMGSGLTQRSAATSLTIALQLTARPWRM
jgi:hypothetical protein